MKINKNRQISNFRELYLDDEKSDSCQICFKPHLIQLGKTLVTTVMRKTFSGKPQRDRKRNVLEKRENPWFWLTT